MWLFRLLPLIVPPDGVGAFPIPDHVPEVLHPNWGVELSAVADENKLDSTASPMVKLLCGVKDSTNGFGPLKAVARSLCLILANCKVYNPLPILICNAYGHSSKQRWMNKQ